MDEISKLKKQIEALDRQIDEYSVTQEGAVEVYRAKHMAQYQAGIEGSVYAPESNMEQLVFQREQLLRELEVAKSQVQETGYDQLMGVEVTIQGTMAATNEAAQQVPARKGIFSRIGSWFKRHFSKNKPDPSVLPVLSKEERAARIMQFRDEENLIKTEQETQFSEAMELFDKLEKKGTSVEKLRNPDVKKETVDYSSIKNAYLEAGWDEAKFKYFMGQITDRRWDEVEENGEKRDAKDGDKVSILTTFFSKKQIVDLVSHKDHDTAVKFLKPLLDFDLAAVLNKYPVHKKMTEEKRVGYVKKLNLEMQKYIMMLQWGQAFAKDLLTEEELDKFNKANFQTGHIMNTIRLIGRPGSPLSYTEKLGNRLNEKADFENCWKNKDRFHGIYDSVCGNIKTVSDAEKDEMDKNGFGQFKYFREKLSEDEKKAIETKDRKVLEDAIISIENFSLITDEGRPRLLGIEKCEQLLRYGKEDLEYYRNSLKSASMAVAMLKDKEAYKSISAEKKMEILDKAEEILHIFKALNIRIEKPDTTASDAKQEGSLDPNVVSVVYMLQKQDKDLEDFASGKWQEKHSDTYQATRKQKGYTLIELEKKIDSVGDVSEAAKKKEKKQLSDYKENKKELNTVLQVVNDVNLEESYLVSSAEKAFSFFKDIMGFSLVDQAGRTRLFGNESVKELLSYTKDDYAYYLKSFSKAESLMEWISQNTETSEQIINEEDISNIKKSYQMIKNAYDALRLRIENPEASFSEVEEKLSESMEDSVWYYRMQKQQVEDFDGKLVISGSATGEMRKLTETERNLKLLEDEKKYAEYAEQKKNRAADVKRALDEEYKRQKSGEKHVPKSRETNAEVDYYKIKELFENNGWIDAGTITTAKKKKPEQVEKYLNEAKKLDFQMFFRELNVGVPYEKNVKDGKIKVKEYEIKIDEILYLLEHRDAVTVEEFLTPLLNFDMEEFLKKYPFDTCETDEELRKILEAEKNSGEIQHLNALSQWAGRFAAPVLSPQQKKRLNKAMAKLNQIQDIEANIREYKFSIKEHMQVNIGDETSIRQLESWAENEKEIKALYQVHTNGYAELRKKEKEAEKEREKTNPKTDAQKARLLIKKLKSLSLVYLDRPRLLGNEDASVLLKYGLEDLDYYARMKEDANTLMDIIKKKPAGLEISSEERARIKDLVQKANNLMLALMSRFSSPLSSRTYVLGGLRWDISDPFWYQRMQNAELKGMQ